MSILFKLDFLSSKSSNEYLHKIRRMQKSRELNHHSNTNHKESKLVVSEVKLSQAPNEKYWHEFSIAQRYKGGWGSRRQESIIGKWKKFN